MVKVKGLKISGGPYSAERVENVINSWLEKPQNTNIKIISTGQIFLSYDEPSSIIVTIFYESD